MFLAANFPIMKKYLCFFWFCLVCVFLTRAQPNVDSLRQAVQDESLPDSSRWDAMDILASHYQARLPDSSKYFGEQLYIEAEEKQDQQFLANGSNQLGIYYARRGDYLKSLSFFHQLMEISERLEDQNGLAQALNNLGNIHYLQGEYEQAIAQFNASLKIREDLGDQRAVAATLNNMGNIFEDQGDYQKALEYFERSLSMKQATGDQPGIAMVAGNMGIIYNNQGQYQQAVDHYQLGLDIYDSLENYAGVARLSVNIGLVYQNQGNFDKALDHYRRAFNISTKMENEDGIGSALHHIGMIYFYLKDYDQALAYARQSLEIREKLGKPTNIAKTLSNIGEIYKAEKEYPKALEYFQRSLQLKEANEDRLGMAFSYTEIGQLYQEQEEYDKAGEQYESGLAIYESLGANDGRATVLQGMGAINYAKGRLTLARSYGEEALSLATEAGNTSVIQAASFLLYQVYKRSGDAVKALEMHERSVQMSDSLERDENRSAVFRYEYQQQALADSLSNQQEKALAELEYNSQLNQQRLQLGFAIGAGGLLAILVAVLYRTSRMRQRTNQLLSDQNKEIEAKSEQNELLLKEIHHRVKNNLQTISSLLYLQSAHIKDADIKQAVAAGRHRVESMALIHQKLYQRDNLAAIEMKDYLSNLGLSLLNTFTDQPDRIQFHIDMDELDLDVDTAVPLGLIVNELITNSLKYAFPGGREGNIRLSLRQLPEDKLELQVSDDGVGMANKEGGTSFGSQLIQLLTAQLGGSIEQEKEGGYKTRILV